MTDPKRWQAEGAPADYARLFQAASSEQPSAASLQRALVSAGVVSATCLVTHSATSAILGTAGSVSGAAAKGGLVSIVTKLVAVSLVSAGAASATAVIVKQHHNRTAQVTAVATTVATRPIAGPGRVALASHAETVSIAAATVPSAPMARGSKPEIVPWSPGTAPQRTVAKHEAAAKAEPPTKSSVPASAAEADDSRDLFEEMRLIDAARANLRSGNPAEALRTAQDYNRRFAAGRFAPEALFLSMQASRQLGQGQVAADAARAIIARFPNGPHVGRARELLQSQGVSDIP